MTTKADFSPADWETVLQGPPTAGLMVLTASRGGMLRETAAMPEAYAQARARHGDSELLDEIVADKPRMEHGKFRSPEELRDPAISGTRPRCWNTRPPPKSAMTTGASCSLSPARPPRPTARQGRT